MRTRLGRHLRRSPLVWTRIFVPGERLNWGRPLKFGATHLLVILFRCVNLRFFREHIFASNLSTIIENFLLFIFGRWIGCSRKNVIHSENKSQERKRLKVWAGYLNQGGFKKVRNFKNKLADNAIGVAPGRYQKPKLFKWFDHNMRHVYEDLELKEEILTTSFKVYPRSNFSQRLI